MEKELKAQLEALSFENGLSHLEKIVNEMENGNLALDQMMNRFEEGSLLSKQCRGKLSELEKKIEILVKDENNPNGNWENFNA